jgi:hypothetical protein
MKSLEFLQKNSFFQKALTFFPKRRIFFVGKEIMRQLQADILFVSKNRKRQSSREAVAQNYRVLG